MRAELLAAAQAELGDDPILWCVAPLFELPDDAPGAGGPVAVAAAAGRLLARRGVRPTLLDGVAFAPVTENHRRTLHPVQAAFASGRRASPLLPERPGPGEAGALLRWGVQLTRRVRELATLADTTPPPALEQATVQAASTLAAWRRTLRRRPLRALVVATQHMVSVRAVVRAAHEAGVPTAYLPHAPAADVPYYRDLPFDLAALRGEGERAWYESLGAEATTLAVVGNPALAPRDLPDPDPTGAAVLALSPQPRATVDRIMGIVAAAGIGPVVVAPHPRMDRSDLRSRLPQGWRMNERTTTYALLEEGPACVIQHRSGIAAEALGLGIPAIEIDLGTPPPYLCSQPPHVRAAADPASLAAAVAAARLTLADPQARAELIDWARRWSHPEGPAAAARAAEAVHDLAARGPAQRLALDGWACAPA